MMSSTLGAYLYLSACATVHATLPHPHFPARTGSLLIVQRSLRFVLRRIDLSVDCAPDPYRSKSSFVVAAFDTTLGALLFAARRSRMLPLMVFEDAPEWVRVCKCFLIGFRGDQQLGDLLWGPLLKDRHPSCLTPMDRRSSLV
jgi:hypothetical protein